MIGFIFKILCVFFDLSNLELGLRLLMPVSSTEKF